MNNVIHLYFKHLTNNLLSCFASSLLLVLLVTVQFACVSIVEGSIPSKTPIENPVQKLQTIHSKLRLLHGNFSEEYPEQLMTAMFLPADAKVLELGGNYGRNSCVIASLLNQQSHFVSMEPFEAYARLLQENRDINGLQFHIEVSALSRVPLIQSGWKTIPSDVLLPGYFRVNTITFSELERKYGVEFDTLVVDCEGAFYYILQEDPEILKNIKLIIIENDFENIRHAEYVHAQFKNYGFQTVYSQAGGWGHEPCYGYFYQVWMK